MGQLRTIGLLAVATALTAMGLMMTVAGEGLARAAGLLCAASSGGCALVLALRLIPAPAPRPDPGGVTLIVPSRTRLAGLSVASALVAATFPLAGGLAAAQTGAAGVWIAIGGATLFGAGALYGVFRLLRPTALYRLDPVGIAGLQGSAWFVPWRAVRGIDPLSTHGQYFLSLDIDPASNAGPPVARARAGKPRAVTIGPQGAAMRFDEFAELVQRYWERGRLMQTHN